MATIEEQIQAFRAWCSACGITWHTAVQIVATDDEGLGVFATADAWGCGGGGIEVGEVIISVPRRAALSLSTHHAVAATGAVLDQKHGLALAAASQPEPMQPWLALWPQETIGSWALDKDSWPAFGWNLELRALHEQQEALARRAHERISSVGEAGAAPTWSKYRWAMGIISSRAADVVLNGERQPALLPFIDMLNHRAYGLENSAVCFEPASASAPGAHDEDRLVVRCVRPVAPNEPVTICYGDKPNAALLHGYGFAVRPNPSDTLLLRVPLGAPTDMLAMQRIAMVPSGLLDTTLVSGSEGGDHEGPVAKGTLSWDAAGTAACLSPELKMLLRVATASSIPELFAALRTMATEDHETEEDDEAEENDEGSELSPAAWGLLRDSVQAALRALGAKGASVEEDESLWPYWPHGAAAVALEARRDLLSSALNLAMEKVGSVTLE